MTISLTPKAILKAKEALLKLGGGKAYIRLGVKGGGCSGYSYVIEFADSKQPKDLFLEFDGLGVVVDPKSMVLLEEVTLDYEVKLMEHGFKFVNPQESSRCSCGESFNTK